jgi:hypothetical protein
MGRKRFDTAPIFNIEEDSVLLKKTAGYTSGFLLDVQESDGTSLLSVSSTGGLNSKSITVGGTTSMEQILEKSTVSPSALSGTVHLDALSGGFYYSTGSTTTNITLNLRGDGSTTLASLVPAGKSFSCVYMITSGSTAGKISSITIGSSTVSVKWFGGSANAYPDGSSSGNVDIYSLTAVKTSDTGAGTFTVFASQAKFG